ncbi:MAG: 4Fe-4S dicluster domain-containing protein [Syntrophaceae bacterium]|nr:4Fe-4S dicluster domain-containing protein [Syntrophaceae bacterium]
MSVVFSKETLKLARKIQGLTGENVMLCYQCKKCTLGCPSAYTMEMKPHELMRAIQLGLEEEIFWSGTLWICLSCETCNTRCPQDINILRVIDGFREMSKDMDYYNPQPFVPALHRIFMALVERFGKIYELGLALAINMRMLTPFKDIDMAYPMLSRGKLKLLPHKSRGAKELQQVMARIRKIEHSTPSPLTGESVGGE